jgi:hypothetical protein
VYAHWDGDDGPLILQQAIKAAMPDIRWVTPHMLLVSLWIKSQRTGADSETGYGIYIGEEITHEEQYEVKEVNLIKHTVSIGSMTFELDTFISALV